TAEHGSPRAEIVSQEITMTSATFAASTSARHASAPSPLAARATLIVASTGGEPAAMVAELDAEVIASAKRAAAELEREARREALRGAIKAVLPPLLGLALFVGIWALIAQASPQLPGPQKVYRSALEVFARPFYVKGPNDQGIGWNILNSLQRVGIGFGLAALVGIPLGFILGRFKFLHAMAAPVISLLRPVSPLAWLPIGLLVFKAANPAAIW